MKRKILNNLKNIRGFRTKRKILVLSVDDYGNVRLHNKKAREELDKIGLKAKSRFDAYDTLETREDLEVLYDTLTSVKDINDRNAVLTAFAMPCNIDFEKIIESNFSNYDYEYLPETFKKLENIDKISYAKTWNLWQEGIERAIMVPQFHGREHLNLKIFNDQLEAKNEQFLNVLRNRSYTSLSSINYKTINYTAAFDFWDVTENEKMKEVLTDGIVAFERVFGIQPRVFMPPTSNIHQSHLPLLKSLGIDFIDTNLIHKQHQGLGKYKKTYNFTGKKLQTKQINLVRNVVFEPTSNQSIDWVNYAFRQIEAAFFWSRPANISSHRVNFCGYIDKKNRTTGINDLKELLKKVVQKWPDVEFMSAHELGDLIAKS